MIAVPSRVDTLMVAWARVGAQRTLFDRRALPVYAVLALATVVVVAAIGAGAFDYDARFFADACTVVGTFLALGYSARWIGFPSIAAGVEMAMLFMATTLLIAFCSVIFAASGLPYRDPMLARADAWFLGFERAAAVAWVAQWPAVMRCAIWVYNSLAVTPQLLVVLLLVARRHDRAWVVVTAMTFAIVMAICTLPLMPALGTPPYAYHFVEVFDGVRNGTLRRLDATMVTGLVTFPSLHAADAVILAWGFSTFGRWGLPLVALNVLMIGSALLVGGHYLVDLIAGIAVAGAAIKMAEVAVRRLDRPPSVGQR